MVNHPNRSKRPKWQPIETAPKDGEAVLLFTPSDGFYNCTATGFFDRGEWWLAFGGIDNPRTGLMPTHWQPLPDPPSS